MCDKISEQNKIENNGLNPQGLIAISEEAKSNLMLLVDEEGMPTKKAAELLSISPTAAGTIISGEIKKLEEASEKIQKQMEMVQKITTVKGQRVKKNTKVGIPKVVKKSGMERLIEEDEIYRILLPGGDDIIQKIEEENIRARMKKIPDEKEKLRIEKIAEVKAERKRKVEKLKMVTQLDEEKYEIQRAKEMEEKQEVAEEERRMTMQKFQEVKEGQLIAEKNSRNTFEGVTKITETERIKENERVRVRKVAEQEQIKRISIQNGSKEKKKAKISMSLGKDKLEKVEEKRIQTQKVAEERARLKMQKEAEVKAGRKQKAEEKARVKIQKNPETTKGGDILTVQDTNDTNNTKVYRKYAEVNDKLRRYLIFLVKDQGQSIQEAANFLMIRYEEAVAIIHHEEDKIRRANDLETVETREDGVIIGQSSEIMESIRVQQANKEKMEIKQKLLDLVHKQGKPIKEAAKLVEISHLEARGIVDEEINRLKAITQKKY